VVSSQADAFEPEELRLEPGASNSISERAISEITSYGRICCARNSRSLARFFQDSEDWACRVAGGRMPNTAVRAHAAKKMLALPRYSRGAERWG